MSNKKITTAWSLAIFFVFLLSVLFWFWVFSHLDQKTANTDTQNDKLSNESYNKTAINSDRGPNRNTPYFVGFNQLITFGVTSDDITYMSDAITNDILYRKNISYAKISLVKDSIATPKINGLKTTYEFKYGTNDSDIQIMKVEDDLESNSIHMTILDEQNQVVFDKTFIENTPAVN